jgi:hypothetical protein
LLDNYRQVSIIISVLSAYTKELLEGKVIEVNKGTNSCTRLKAVIISIGYVGSLSKDSTIHSNAINKVLKLFKQLVSNYEITISFYNIKVSKEKSYKEVENYLYYIKI